MAVSWQEGLKSEVLFQTNGPFTNLISLSMCSLGANEPPATFAKSITDWVVSVSPDAKEVHKIFQEALEPSLGQAALLSSAYKAFHQDRPAETQQQLFRVFISLTQSLQADLAKIFREALVKSIQPQVEKQILRIQGKDMEYIEAIRNCVVAKRSGTSDEQLAGQWCQLADEICGPEEIDDEAVLVDEPSAYLGRKIEFLKQLYRDPLGLKV